MLVGPGAITMTSSTTAVILPETIAPIGTRACVGDLVKIILGKYDYSPYNNQLGIVVSEIPKCKRSFGTYDMWVMVGEKTLSFDYFELRVISKAKGTRNNKTNET